MSVVTFLFLLAGMISLKLLEQRQRAENIVWRETVRSQIRSDVQAELTERFQGQIEQMVAMRVEAALADRLAKSPAVAVAPVIVSANIPTQDVSHQPVIEENIGQTTQRTVAEEIKKYRYELDDRELDGYVASGGTDAAVKIPGGIVKNTSNDEVLLAAVQPGAKVATDKGKSKKSSGAATGANDATAASKRAESLDRALAQRGSILLPKGKLQLEQGFTYAHFSSNRINLDGFTIQSILLVGAVAVEKVNRDIFIETTSFKYGLLNNLQTEIRVPMRYEHDSANIADSLNQSIVSETNRSTNGLGDVMASVSRQVAWDNGGLIPDMVASMAVKSNTGRSPYNNDIAMGTGHWATSLALVAAKSSDPAVIFSSMSYTYNFMRDVHDYGRIKPGDSFGYSLGTAIALSYQTAINFSFDQSLTTKMKRNGDIVPGTFQNSANFKTGFNWAWSERFSTDLGVSFGLTPDSPDFTVDLRFPYLF